MKKVFRFVFPSLIVGGALGTAVWAQIRENPPVKTTSQTENPMPRDVVAQPAQRELLNPLQQPVVDLLLFHDPVVALGDPTQAATIQEYKNAQSDKDKQKAKSELSASVAKELNARLEMTQKELDRIQKRLDDARKKLETRTNRKDEIVGRRVAELLGEIDVLAWDSQHPVLSNPLLPTLSLDLSAPLPTDLSTSSVAPSLPYSNTRVLPPDSKPDNNAEPPVVKVYRISGVDPTTAMDVLQSSIDIWPNTKLTLDPKTNSVVLSGVLEVHERVASILDELAKASVGDAPPRNGNVLGSEQPTKFPSSVNYILATIDQYRNELIEAQADLEISLKGLTKEGKESLLPAIEKRIRTIELKYSSMQGSEDWARLRLAGAKRLAEERLSVMEQQLDRVYQLVEKGAAGRSEVEEKKLLCMEQTAICKSIDEELDRLGQLKKECESLLTTLKGELAKAKE